MDRFTVELLSGICCMVLFLIIDRLIRKYDQTCTLPRTPKYYYTITLLMGLFVGRVCNSIVVIAFIDISVAYTIYMMFTDNTTYQLYTCLNIVGFAAGIIYLFLQGQIIDYGKDAWLFLLIVIGSCIFRAISLGDGELLISLSPYLYLYSTVMGYSMMFTCLLFYALTLLATIVMNIKKFIKLKQKKFPYAMSVAVAYGIIIISFGIN